MYSNIRFRAGLVTLVLALISISLVSAVPIPIAASQPGLSPSLSSLSNPSHNGQHNLQQDTRRIEKFPSNGQMTKVPGVARAFTGKHISDDDQLVRRGVSPKVKAAFKKAGQKIKAGFKKLGKGIKQAAKKVGHFMKTTGAKIAKFGLKVVESVGKVVGKVAAFIPVIGKSVQQAINGVSKAAGVISDHIHAKLSPKLERGMKVMNTADKYLDYIPRRRDLSDEEGFQQRDISSDTYFDDDYEHWE